MAGRLTYVGPSYWKRPLARPRAVSHASTLLLSSVNMSVRGACLVKNPFLVDAMVFSSKSFEIRKKCIFSFFPAIFSRFSTDSTFHTDRRQSSLKDLPTDSSFFVDTGKYVRRGTRTWSSLLISSAIGTVQTNDACRRTSSHLPLLGFD